jgi:hypothetical protein
MPCPQHIPACAQGRFSGCLSVHTDLLRNGPQGTKNPPGGPAGPAEPSLANKLFGPPAPFASECDEVRLGFPDLAPRYHHERAAVQARRIVSSVQRIEQEFLVAGHSVLSPRPNFRPERWLQSDRSSAAVTENPPAGDGGSFEILAVGVLGRPRSAKAGPKSLKTHRLSSLAWAVIRRTNA